MHLFKREKIVDERVVNLRNQIYKEAFIIAMAVSVIAILVKYYLYGVKLSAVVAELFILLIPTCYATVKTVWLGIYSDEMELHDRANKIPLSTKNIFLGLGSGIAIALFFGIRSSMVYGNASNWLWYFFLVFVASLMIYVPIFVLGAILVDSVAKKAGKNTAPEDRD